VLAEISLDCHRRFAWFLGQVLGWHNHGQAAEFLVSQRGLHA
jgi:hypothetical protein